MDNSSRAPAGCNPGLGNRTTSGDAGLDRESGKFSHNGKPSTSDPVQNGSAYRGSVTSDRRFRKDFACPICGGTEDDKRGDGSRCYGFVSKEGDWAHCTRQEFAGNSPLKSGSGAYPHLIKGKCPCGTEHAPGDPPTKKTKAKKAWGTIEAEYSYRRTEVGPVEFQAVRTRDPKGFYQRRRGQNGQWVYKDIFADLTPFLYRRPELLAASPDEVVLIPEGEKDVENLRALGFVSTCNPMGAKKWRDDYSEDLRGRRVAIFEDNDQDGRIHGQQVARSLHGKAASVKIVELPSVPEKGDVSDFLAGGGTVEDLHRLISEAPPYRPDADEIGEPISPIKADDDPHRLARLFLGAHFQHPDGPSLVHHRDEFHRFNDDAYGVYRNAPEDLTGFIEDEFNRLNVEAIERVQAAYRAQGKEPPPDKLPKARKVTASVTNNTLHALRSETALDWDKAPPCWLDDDGTPRPAALEVLPAGNGFVNLTTLEVFPKTPRFFSHFTLDYDFVPSAPEPARWLRFLKEIWPNDPEVIREIQKWFGYLLTPNTDQQKILFLKGPPRSGKGTIIRVLTKLLGAHNVINPTFASMATNFGLWSFVGKSVAIITDAHVAGSSSERSQVVERLKNISGEDDVTIDRKYLAPITTRLNTRLVISTNLTPNFRDSSGALANRMSPLTMTQSFLGREEIGLDKKLYAELAGILLWSIAGRKMLEEDGRFHVPESSMEALNELLETTSPLMRFVDECCTLDTGDDREGLELTPIHDFFEAFDEWCRKNKHESGSSNIFSGKLCSAFPKIKTERPRELESRGVRRYRGIVLNGEGEVLRNRNRFRNRIT